MVGTALFEQILNGMTTGVVYVLIASGLSIIFGVMDVINFAHGELFALGAYFAFSITMPFDGMGFWIALIVAPVLVGVVGMVIERFTIRPLYDRNPLYHILLTFGLVLIINDLIEIAWGKRSKPLSPPEYLNQPIEILGFSYPIYNYFMLGFGAVFALGTWWVLNNTRFGLIVRAGAQDRGMVRNLGIDIDKYYTLVFGFGAALAGIAGVILGAQRSVEPTMGNSVIIPAFVIVVIGGLGSFRGAVIGGLGVGVIQNLTQVYLDFYDGILIGLVIYILMIIVLLVKPQGLFGNPEWQTTGGQEGRLLAGERGGVLSHRTRVLLGGVAVLLLALIPFGVDRFYSPFMVTIFINILIWSLFALSLDFVMGYAGLVSLGHAMFFGLGAYASVLTLIHLTQSIFVALVLAVLINAVIAWFVGHLSIRVSGVYFAMITLAFAQLFYNLVFKFDFTGGSDGIFGAPEPLYGFAGMGVKLSEIEVGIEPFTVTGKSLRYYFILFLVVGSYLLARRMMNAPFGSVLQSIRESENRAEFVGYDVIAYKRRAFVVSGCLAGLAGGLLGVNNAGVAPEFLHWIKSGEVIVMNVLGGMGTLYGPMIGAGVFVWFRDQLSSDIEQWRLVLGVIFVVFVILVPRGIVSLPAMAVRIRDRIIGWRGGNGNQVVVGGSDGEKPESGGETETEAED